jgi:nicotinamidase-related amidase
MPFVNIEMRAKTMLNSSPRTALIVIDVQRAFDEWEAAGRRRNNPEAITRIVELLTAFRGDDAPIFHIRHEGTRSGSSFSRGATGYPVKDEAREMEGEPVIVKRVNSAFIGTDLESRLRAAGIQTVVICGATTNHCVETTTRMAGNLGFDAWLVRDATWTFDRIGPDGDEHSAEDIHAMTLANLNGEFARIVLASEAIAALAAV